MSSRLSRRPLAVMYRLLDARLNPHLVYVSSTIPRSVGLAGSSAIVIADNSGDDGRSHGSAVGSLARPASRHSLASLALVAEREILGINAGLQDRVVQTFGGTVAMEFGPDSMGTLGGLAIGTYRRIGPLPSGFFVAYRADATSNSGQVHSNVNPGDSSVREGDASSKRRQHELRPTQSRGATPSPSVRQWTKRSTNVRQSWSSNPNTSK